MTILLYFHFGTFRNFKHYYLFFIKGTMKSYFPKAVSYNRFVELESGENGAFPPTRDGCIHSLSMRERG